MAVQKLQINLAFFQMNTVTSDEFLASLDLDDINLGIEQAPGKIWGSILLFYGSVELLQADFPVDALCDALKPRLSQITEWLEQMQVELFEGSKNFILTMQLHFWNNSEQMSVQLPPQFLRACSEAGISIIVKVHNDIDE